VVERGAYSTEKIISLTKKQRGSVEQFANKFL